MMEIFLNTGANSWIHQLVCTYESMGILSNLFKKAQSLFLPFSFAVYKECNYRCLSEHSEMHWHCHFPFNSLSPYINWFFFFFLRKHCHTLVKDARNDTDLTSSFKTTKADGQQAVSSHQGLWL